MMRIRTVLNLVFAIIMICATTVRQFPQKNLLVEGD
jgi:hypothetical protein